MSEPKVQLIDPQGNINMSGLSATGVITATTYSGSGGVVTGLTGTPNLNLGIVTATSFVGQGDGHAAGLTGTPNLNLGVTTATSFVGDATGKAAGLTGTPNLNVGLVTATGFSGNVTGTVTGNVTGLAASVTPGVNLGVGVCTAIQYHGDGSGLTGIGGSTFTAQQVTATSGTTTIDLSNGNLIYLVQNTDTTIAFSNPNAALGVEQIIIVRTATSYTLAWPNSVLWTQGIIPPLDTSGADAHQIFRLTTVDTGTTYQAWENASYPKEGDEMFVWGYNNYGMLGLNEQGFPFPSDAAVGNKSSPTQVGSENTWDPSSSDKIMIPGYSKDSMVFKTNGTLWGWGENEYGVLGLNDEYSRSSPTQVGMDIERPDWSSMVVLSSHSMAIKTNGRLWVWGRNNYGQLGRNESTPLGSNHDYSSPVQLPGTPGMWPTATRRLGGADTTSMGIQTDGTLWSWGRNYAGRLGHNDQVDYSSPTQVGTDSTWDKLSVDAYYNFGAIKTDGTLWVWGSNQYGQLGQNEPSSPSVTKGISSPTQIPGTTWSWVATNYDKAMMGIKTDGTLWTWGADDHGQLGLDDANISRSSPTQVGTDTTWSKVYGVYNDAMLAFKTDGTMWSWGRNVMGVLGLNQSPSDLISVSSPNQIPGTWESMMGGGRNMGISFK